MARQIWDLAGISLPRMGFSSSSVFLNIYHLVQLLENPRISCPNILAIPWILWQIWKTRNAFIFESIRYEAQSVVDRAREDATIWRNLHQQEIAETIEMQRFPNVLKAQWEKPALGHLKCNVSSSWINSSKNCGVSWILRDCTGSVVFHSRRSYSRVQSNLEAELLSILWATESLTNLRQERVTFESVSGQVVEAIFQPDKCPMFCILLAEIRSWLDALKGWELKIIPRKANTPAYEIARSVTRDNRYQSYISRNGPNWLQSRIIEEACRAVC
ncbi:unnamed protein product [Arabidopsis halleri]